MKAIRASRKLEKAIDALVDLQQDYMDELVIAEVVYEVGTALDSLNSVGAALDAIDNS